MSYCKTQIGDLVTLRQGFAINKKTNHHMSEEPTQLHLLRIGDMKDGNFSIFVRDTIPEKFIAKENDIIYTRTGQVGLVFRNQYGVVHNNCFTVTSNDEDVLSQQYLYYALQEESFYEEANSRATGAAQPDLPHGAFNSIEIFLPPIEVQRKITYILDSYNSLIENYQKQIKLLEEAAQRLYKEWFVDLRFPGCEETEFADGLPVGWAICELGDVITINEENISKKYAYEYVDYIDLGSVSNGRTESITRYLLKDAPGRAKRVAKDGDMAWGMVRPNLKSYTYVFNPTETTIYSTGFAVLHPVKIPFSYLFCYASTDEFVGYLINCTNGAAYPAVKTEHFENAKIQIPSFEILQQFHLIMEPIFRKMENLHTQIEKIVEVRERLLPKLMSGEIEV